MPLTTGDHPWNGRFNGVGNGDGLAGSIRYSDMLTSLQSGFATAGTDTGHQASPTEGNWMWDHPELLSNFSYRAIHMMTRDAKAIIQAYYGQAPQYSYFTGCSDGGQQGLMEAQRYPADYDGIVAGASTNNQTHSWPGEIWPAYVTHRSGHNVIPKEKLPTIHEAAMAACDAGDGISDGVISNPLACDFDPSAILCQGTDAPDCLTTEEVDSLKLIYAGLKNPTTGEQFWPGLEPGSELGWMRWGGLLPGPYELPLNYFSYLIFSSDPNWFWKSFDFTDPQDFAILIDADARYGPIINANDPDLTAFQELGGKLIVYHGWADQQIAPRNSVNYYNSVATYMGGEAAIQEFLRLFMVPGMMHCVQLEGAITFDTLAAVQQWVEQGTAPAQIIATHIEANSVVGTRPLCPYPKVANYSGTGSTDEAENFVCDNP